MRRVTGLTAALSVLVMLAWAAPTGAQEYPPAGVEVGCSATVLEPGGDVTCGVGAGTFRAGTPVEATLSSGGGQAAAPAVVAVSVVPLAQGSDSFTLTREVTAAEDGSAQVTFGVPADAVLGPVMVVFEGTAPDGSHQRLSEASVLQIVADEDAEDLSDTGAATVSLLWTAGVLVIVGGLLVWGVRRRSGESEDAPVG